MFMCIDSNESIDALNYFVSLCVFVGMLIAFEKYKYGIDWSTLNLAGVLLLKNSSTML